MTKYYLMLSLAVLFNTTSQILQKYGSERLNEAGVSSLSLGGKTVTLLTSLPILIALSMAFFAAVVWMFALSKLPLSHAYPFLSISFVLVALAGHYIFGEPLTTGKMTGVAFIMLGVIMSAQS